MKTLRAAALPNLSSFDCAHPVRVSPDSRWSDARWSFPSPTDGQSRAASEMIWDFPVGKGCFSDQRWSATREALRWVLWSLLRNPYGGRRLKETSIAIFAVGARNVVRWMSDQCIEDFSQLSPAVCRQYVEDCVEQQVGERDGNFTAAFLYRKLHILEWIHAHSPVLRRQGLPTVGRAPFGNQTAYSIARKFATKRTGKTGPLPDPLAIGLMNEATRLIGQPAEDVIALYDAMLVARSEVKDRGPFHTPRDRNEAMRRIAIGFKFSSLAGDSNPWRGPIGGEDNKDTSYRLVSIEVRALIQRIVNAAIITIQSQTGIRANELCGLRTGPAHSGSVPDCIEIRGSASGLNETFFLKGQLAKGLKAQRRVEWVAGMRPKGSTYLPPAVVAINVLDRLVASWRIVLGTDRLLVTTTHGLAHSKRGVFRQTTNRILLGLRTFAKETRLDKSSDGVAIIADSGFRMLKTTQWRCTWAHFIFKTDTRLLRDISAHFKHLSLAMTEHAYIGNDPELLETLDETRLAETARFFYEATTGRRVVSGSAGHLVEEHRASIAKLLSKSSNEESLDNIRQWVETHDLRIWLFNEGKCLMNSRPDQSRCHQVAGSSHWSNSAPNYRARSPDLCLGCACFAVDETNREFWLHRYNTNRAAFEAALAQGVERDFRVAKARMDQAKTVLDRLDNSQ